MNKSEIIKEATKHVGLDITQDGVSKVLNSIVDVIESAVRRGEEVKIADFLIIKVERKKARTGRNPKTGETIDIPAKNAVKILATKALRDAANGD